MAQAKTKRVRRATIETNLDHGTVTWKLPSGHEVTLHALKMPAAIRKQAELHGFKQKGSDSYADPDVDPEHALRGVIAELEAGNWSTRGEGGGRPLTMLATAISETIAKGKSVEECQDYLDSVYLTEQNGQPAFLRAEKVDDEYVFDDDGEAHKKAIKAIRAFPAVKARLDAMVAEAAAKRAAASAAQAGDSEVSLNF